MLDALVAEAIPARLPCLMAVGLSASWRRGRGSYLKYDTNRWRKLEDALPNIQEAAMPAQDRPE